MIDLDVDVGKARQKGFEPLTHGLEGRCSIHLSYWRTSSTKVGASRFERPTTCAQGRCATRLRYAPSILLLQYMAERGSPNTVIIGTQRFRAPGAPARAPASRAPGD